MLYGRFEGGGNWTEFQYEAFQAQNPGYKALFSNGTAVWTVATIDGTDSEYTMDCTASPGGTSTDGYARLHVVINALCGQAHKTSSVASAVLWR